MNIEYLAPLSRGFDRMKYALFKPFDLNVWMRVGFTAFLAGLLDGNGGSSGNSKGGDADFGDILDAPYQFSEWLFDNPGWFFLITFGAVCIFAIIVVFNWLSSRGKFMFLDNVVHKRALVSKPWHDFKNLGNSLFLWRFVYGLICFIVIFGFLGFLWNSTSSRFWDSNGDVPWFHLFQMGFLFILVILTISYIEVMLDSFVIPIMYKQNLSATQAWQIFLDLHWANFAHFILFGLLAFMIMIAIIVMVVLFGLLTCCIGFLLLAIPYINSVVLLPITYSLRAFSLEFLAQFGEEWDTFPQVFEE